MRPEMVTNGDSDGIPADELDLETGESNVHLELEAIRLQQLMLQEKQLECRQRMLLLKQEERKSLNLNTSNIRCILPDGKIVERNISERPSDVRDPDSLGAGAGDSNDNTVCSCKKTKCSWDQPASDDGSSTPSTCVLCSTEDINRKIHQDKSDMTSRISKKSEYSSKIVDSRTTDVTVASTTKKTDYSKTDVSKKSDATSKKFEVKRHTKSEVTCDLKYSDFYSDSEEEADETNRLIQLRNSDYMDIVEDDLKLVIALAGYPKSKMRLRQMEKFQRSLSEVIDMQLKAGLLKKVPSFLDYYLNRGALVCICKDTDTRDWMVRVSPGLQERMCYNLVLLHAKVKRLCLAVLKIPRSCWPATAQDAFKLLQYFNPSLKTELWKIYAQNLIDDVECTSFLIDRVSGEVIRGPNFKNVIDYNQMEFELTGYTEIYYECLLSEMEKDLRSVTSRVKLLDELRSEEATPKNASDISVRHIIKEIKEENILEDESATVVMEETEDQLRPVDHIKKELETSLQRDVLKKLKDVKYISEKDEVLVWSDETNNYSDDNEKSEIKIDHRYVPDNVASTSGVAVSDKTESIYEINDNLISKNSNLNIDSNRGIAYHRRTNYLDIENELKVAITLEGYPQNKLEGTHIRRLKHLFKEYLHRDMKSQRFANMIIPKFQDIYLSNGAVIYICDSLETKDYLTEVLPKFINTTGLKLSFRDIKNLVGYTRIVMRLPKDFAHVESVVILQKLQSKYPGLKPDCWKYYSDVAGKQKRQFGVDPESLDVIKSPDFDPIYEGEKLNFRIIDRQKRDVSFEETETAEFEDITKNKAREAVVKNIFVPIQQEVLKAPLTRIRTNHYSELIADDLKLYMGPANYPETRVEEFLFHSIKRAFENVVFESVQKGDLHEEIIPKLHDMYLFDGVIFIICQNSASRHWIEEAVPIINSKLHIHLKSTEFRGAVGIVSMYVKTDKDTDDVIEILQQQNPRLRTKYWRKISTVRTKSKLDVVLQIDKLSAQVITSQGFKKYIGSNAVQFKLGHLQSLLKPKLSLEEFEKSGGESVPNKIAKLKTTKTSQIENDVEEPKTVNSGPVLNLQQWDSRIICERYSRALLYQTELEDYVNMKHKEKSYYTGIKSERCDLDPVIIEPDSSQTGDTDLVLPENQGYCKLILKVPMSIIPENKDDLNILFDLLEDKNPGLNTELWQIYTDAVYPNNGKFTLFADKQSVAIIRGKNFDGSIGGEKLKFYF